VSLPPNLSNSALPAHYQVRQRLGEGGFGEVFEAWDDKLARSVAVKRLKNIGDAIESGRLLKEARLAASLQHSAFVKIYALEGERESQSIVMELVRGQTLRQMGSVNEAQALNIVRQIAEAMAEAHDSGLVHGDLKPSNVMVEPSGAVRILDFGLASQADSQTTMTLAQADPQGTIAYMAPERMLGHALTPQTDIYALGVILYELLAGARPFPDLSGLALAAAHVQSSAEQWPYPAGANPELVKLVHLMAATDMQQRLKTMWQVCERLSALDGVPLDARSKPASRRSRQSFRDLWAYHQRRALIAGVILLVLAGGWLVTPYVSNMAAVVAAMKPYSEAVEMREGLKELAMWDRPGGLNSAEKHFSNVLARNSNNAAAVAGMAMVYVFRYNTEYQDDVWLNKARVAAQQAVRLNDQLALSHIAHGMVLTQEGKGEQALVDYDRALLLDPANVFGLSGKIHALRKLRRLDDALQNAQANLTRYPLERVFADHVGTVLYMQSRYKEAEAAFRHSIQLQPDAVVAYANLSAALASQNRSDESLRVLQQGLEVRPSAWLFGNLGSTLFMRGDYLGASAAFESAVATRTGNPADYLGWANLADALLWIPGRESETRAAYARAIELLAPRLARSPDDVTLVSRMALYLARVGEKDKCQQMLTHALSLAPRAPDVQFRAGLAYELIAQRQLALAALTRAIKLGYPTKFVETAPELVDLRRDPGYEPPK
jgi:serine/threonine-protein kinase